MVPPDICGRAGAVAGADIPVFREYLTDGQDALLVPPGDVAPLAVAMVALMADESVAPAPGGGRSGGGGAVPVGGEVRRHLRTTTRSLLKADLVHAAGSRLDRRPGPGQTPVSGGEKVHPPKGKEPP